MKTPETLYVKWMCDTGNPDDGFWFTCDFPMDGATQYRKEFQMSKQAQTLNAWFTLWDAVKHMLDIDLEPTAESQELIDALLALAED